MDKEFETLEYFKKKCLGNIDIFKSQFKEDSLGCIVNKKLFKKMQFI